jgi:limonene 1,2-monooxygenase
VRFGLQKYLDYARTITPGRFGNFAGKDPVDVMLESSHIVIGTPDDAITVLEKLREKQGEFGAFLHQCHDWADWEATKKSYELYMRFVVPHFSKANAARAASYDWWKEHSVEASGKTAEAAKATFEKFKMESDKAKSGMKAWPLA